MSKRRYKEYLRDDTATIPRTTRWRNNDGFHVDYLLDSNNTEFMNNQVSVNQPRLVQLDYSSYDEADEMPDQLDESVLSDNDQPFSDLDTDFDFISDERDDFSSSSVGNNWDEISVGDDFDESMDSNSFDGCDDGCESSNQESNQFGFDHGGHQPIYEGADLTQNQSLLLLMSFVLKHQLTNDALGDFLTIMNMHLPNVVPDTKYLFYKKFNHQGFVRHYFCANCTFYFGPSTEGDPNRQCSCDVPSSVDTAKVNKWYFSYWPLQSQLRLLLQDDEIANCLLNRMERDYHGDHITDATDGNIYKQLKETHGYGPNDISLLWNADGVPVFRYVVD
jgi:hypothetical protein